jgi:hypothetical protein
MKKGQRYHCKTCLKVNAHLNCVREYLESAPKAEVNNDNILHFINELQSISTGRGNYNRTLCGNSLLPKTANPVESHDGKPTNEKSGFSQRRGNMNYEEFKFRDDLIQFFKQLAGGLLLALIAWGCFVLAGCM